MRALQCSASPWFPCLLYTICNSISVLAFTLYYLFVPINVKECQVCKSVLGVEGAGGSGGGVGGGNPVTRVSNGSGAVQICINLVQTMAPGWRQIESEVALDLITIPAVSALARPSNVAAWSISHFHAILCSAHQHTACAPNTINNTGWSRTNALLGRTNNSEFIL